EVQQAWEEHRAEHEYWIRERAEIEVRDNFLRRAARRQAYTEPGAFGSGPRMGLEEPARWINPQTGREIHRLPYGAPRRMLDGPGHSHPQLSWRKSLRGITTGNWEGAAQERSMSEGTGSAGGFLVPTPLSDQVIDRARNAVVTMKAGATVVPMDAATLAIARVTGDPT